MESKTYFPRLEELHNGMPLIIGDKEAVEYSMFDLKKLWPSLVDLMKENKVMTPLLSEKDFISLSFPLEDQNENGSSFSMEAKDHGKIEMAYNENTNRLFIQHSLNGVLYNGKCYNITQLMQLCYNLDVPFFYDSQRDYDASTNFVGASEDSRPSRDELQEK